MSQPFACMFSIVGAQPELSKVAAHFEDEWRAMEEEDSILPGFRWIQSSPPEKLESTADSMTWLFSADGQSPTDYAVVLSSIFPNVRIHLAAADSSQHEWLAVAIAAKNGEFSLISEDYYEVEDLECFDDDDDDGEDEESPNVTLARELLLKAEALNI